MPRGDGTGPAGMGPTTGRAAGFCAGYGVPGYMNPAGGRGFAGWGRGRGGGRGHCHWHWATGVPGWARVGYGCAAYAGEAGGGRAKEQELEMLRSQAEHFERALTDTRQRIEQLEVVAQE
jgi:hypothetical protein